MELNRVFLTFYLLAYFICVVCCTDLTVGPNIHSSAYHISNIFNKWYQSDVVPQRQQTTEKTEKRSYSAERKDQANNIYFPEKKNMATQSSTNVEIRKFDGKNFTLWKEMMQDVLIIRSQIEAIRHNNKPASMIADKWCSLDKIARSTIRMHLVEKVYFNMAKDTTTFSMWEKVQAVYEKKSSSFKLKLI